MNKHGGAGLQEGGVGEEEELSFGGAAEALKLREQEADFQLHRCSATATSLVLSRIKSRQTGRQTGGRSGESHSSDG